MQERFIATADLGSSKIAITVAKVEGSDIQILYYCETPSEGIRHSEIFNPIMAARSLKSAVSKAEDELGIRILQLSVNLPRYRVRQETARGTSVRPDPNSCICQEEIDCIKDMALSSYPLPDESKEDIFGAEAQSFTTEDLFQENEKNIIGTTSDSLEGNFKIFVGKRKSVMNIEKMMNECGIALAHTHFTPAIVGNAVLSDEEKENGVALVEIGAGVSSVTIYQNNILRYYASFPYAGWSITKDIKTECAFSEKLAENIKLAYGACMPDKLPSFGEKTIHISNEETGAFNRLPVKFLSDIITCRSKEIINALLYLIQDSGLADNLHSGVVLIGGGCILTNFSNLLKEMSGYNVRIAFPRKGISSSGCPGIGETGAVTSVGMILADAADEYLNCLEKAPETENDFQNMEGTVFGDVEEPQFTGKVKRPKRDKAPKREIPDGLKMVWGKIGNLFDEAN